MQFHAKLHFSEGMSNKNLHFSVGMKKVSGPSISPRPPNFTYENVAKLLLYVKQRLNL